MGFVVAVAPFLVLLGETRRGRRSSGDVQPWSLISSPYGPGTWLVGSITDDAAHAFVPPGARSRHDENDASRQRWRYLTVLADCEGRPTITVLDTHEAYAMVPSEWRGWVLQQTLRHSDGTISAADLREVVVAMGDEPLAERALMALGRVERIRARSVLGVVAVYSWRRIRAAVWRAVTGAVPLGTAGSPAVGAGSVGDEEFAPAAASDLLHPPIVIRRG
jgi:hypothetical protein